MNRRIAITIKPTNDCNMRCRHCYHAEEGFSPVSMKIEYARKMLLVASREYEEIHVVFHGGEPTLWGIDNFRNVLRYEDELMKSRPGLVIKNAIQTNGVLFDEEWIRLFREYKFVIGISFDGPHNDDLRMQTEKVYDNMLMLKEKGIRFGALCVESGLSIKNLKDTYDWFNREGINFKVIALFMSGEAKEHSELELDINEYVDEVVKMYRYWLFDQECRVSVKTFEDLLKVSDKLYCIQYGGSCIHNRICLNPNGDLYPCGRPYTDDFILGNIEDLELISEAFASSAYVKLVEISAERARQCREKCEYFGVCKGGCVSSAIMEGSFEKIDNVTCVRAKRMLGAVTEVNNEVYGMYDSRTGLEKLNPRALRIMEKSRTGQFEYSHVR